MTVRAGIDLSMTSPVICVHDDALPLKFENCKIYSFGTYERVKKLEGVHQNISIMKQPSWNHDIERFQKVALWVVSVCKMHNVTKVSLEDYSYNSQGKVFNIAEMTGITKLELFKREIPISLVAIKNIKKNFTGNGNAGKDLMYASFVKRTGVNLTNIISIKEHLTTDKQMVKHNETPFELKPIDDIVDSFAVLINHPDFVEVKDV